MRIFKVACAALLAFSLVGCELTASSRCLGDRPQVVLTWDADPDRTYYRVDSTIDGATLATVWTTQTYYVDDKLGGRNGADVVYRVRAFSPELGYGEEQVVVAMLPLCGASECSVEICDGVDNDCDGQVDEDGVCAPICTPTVEVCDGADNNCNGSVDENLGSTTCGVGQCRHTVQNCVGGSLQTCDAFAGATSEVCGDGIDNDCDGQTDEGDACAPTNADDFVEIQGGGGGQQNKGVASNAAGEIAVAGFSSGTVTFGATSLSVATGALVGYAAKYAADGSLAWARKLTPGNPAAGDLVIVNGVAIDAAGNVAVVGYFSGSMAADGTTLSSAGGQDLFIVKYASNGALAWSKRFGGAYADHANAVAFDSNGDVLVTGHYADHINFGGGDLHEDKITPDLATLYVLKLGADGGHRWSQSFYGTGIETGTSIAISTADNVVVGGTLSNRADLGNGLLRSFGGVDGFVLQLTSSGAHSWSRQLGGTNNEAVTAVATDPAGNIAITGRFRANASFGGSTLSCPATVSDVFVASYTAGGVHRWSKSGGSFGGEDQGLGIAFLADGGVLVTGDFMNTATFDGWSVTSLGSRDIFVVEYSEAGAVRSLERWGGTGTDQGSAAFSADGERVVVGGFFRNAAAIFSETFSSAGGSDGFLVHYAP